MLIYSSFRLPTRGESSPTALVSWYYGLSKCTIPFLSSSTISTAGLANVIALTDECCCVHGTECVGNEAARKQVTQLYYQQIGTTRDEMSSPDLSSCWCRGEERGKKQHPNFAHPKQQCDKITSAMCGISSQPWPLLRHRAASQTVPLGSCMICWDSVSQGKQSCRSLPGKWSWCALWGEHAVDHSRCSWAGCIFHLPLSAGKGFTADLGLADQNFSVPDFAATYFWNDQYVFRNQSDYFLF